MSNFAGSEEELLDAMHLLLNPEPGTHTRSDELSTILEDLCGVEISLQTVTELIFKAFPDAQIKRKRIKVNTTTKTRINTYPLYNMLITSNILIKGYSRPSD